MKSVAPTLFVALLTALVIAAATIGAPKTPRTPLPTGRCCLGAKKASVFGILEQKCKEAENSYSDGVPPLTALETGGDWREGAFGRAAGLGPPCPMSGGD